VSRQGQRPLVRRLGNIVPGVFTLVLAKHSKSFSLIDCISVGVDRMQRNFEARRVSGGPSLSELLAVRGTVSASTAPFN
jgi:hypothetical protein